MKLLAGLYSFVLLFWVVNPKSLSPVSPDSCHINAWVRAPDLDPGQVIPGQVRIKANGTCDPIIEYSLILRFKERAWLKLPKPDIILPQEPDKFIHQNISKIDRNSVFKGSNHFSFFQDPLWGEYAEDISDPSLWDIVEEERIAFESRYRLDEAITPLLLGKGVIHNFGLLVPTTDYPPTPLYDFVLGSMKNKNTTAEGGGEHIYLYTVEIKFDNGTTIEIPAGYTAFKTMGHNHDPEPEVVTANFTEILSRQASNNLNISLIINITFPHGRILEQGSNHNLTFTLCDRTQFSGDTHSNYSLALGSPTVYIRTSYHNRWVETLSPKNNFTMSSQEYLGCQITPTSSPTEDLCNSVRRLRDYGTDDTSSWNLSTSKSLQIAQKAFPSFETHYRSFKSQLIISVPIRHFQEIKNQTRTLDEDFYWVPTTVTEKENNRFLRPLNTQIPIIISPNVKPDIPSTHYLSSHARHPLFVDQSTIYGLSQLSVEERDFLAPKSVPIIKRSTENVVRRRYLQESTYYVGDTWQRKVLNGPGAPDLESGRDGNSNALVIQVPRN